jgi:hypothetical protein
MTDLMADIQQNFEEDLNLDTAATKLLIALAFLVPPGTDINKTLGGPLADYRRAVELNCLWKMRLEHCDGLLNKAGREQFDRAEAAEARVAALTRDLEAIHAMAAAEREAWQRDVVALTAERDEAIKESLASGFWGRAAAREVVRRKALEAELAEVNWILEGLRK